MPQSEITFLLSFLNSFYKEGREADNLRQTTIIHRLFALGVWAEFHPDRELWYVHCNDESGRWEE